MRRLAKSADTCSVGTFAVTSTKVLPSDKWKVLDRRSFNMSWGPGTIYIHRKVL